MPKKRKKKKERREEEEEENEHPIFTSRLTSFKLPFFLSASLLTVK
jgi:hypothetical protein